MQLFETIVNASQRQSDAPLAAGDAPIAGDSEALPVVLLTCIDPRLNQLIPQVLNLAEDQLIWLRNAGNIIFDPMSSMMRTLSLACAVKGGREIAVIGHTDCRVRQTSVAVLMERFKSLGINRATLPDNLNEFFGLFASERQNVLRGAEIIRSSPLIGPRIPVHGLLLDLSTRRLEWVVNGYAGAVDPQNVPATPAAQSAPVMPSLAPFHVAEMKFPDFKIGETVPAEAVSAPIAMEPTSAPISVTKKAPELVLNLEKNDLFKVVGEDHQIYGPVAGQQIIDWFADGRVDGTSLVQRAGYAQWRPLSSYGTSVESPVQSPPSLPPALPGARPKRPRSF